MRILVDGVFFQLSSTGITRVWASLLSRLARTDSLEIVALDRGGFPSMDGVKSVEFPSYNFTHTANDSILIQQFCDKHRIDVFTSTYYTTALTTPQVQMVYDMIPEVMGFDLTARAWKEKQLALSYASQFACISNNTRDDLLKFYPDIDPSRAVVTYCGVDPEIFNPSAAEKPGDWREKLGVQREFFLLVGSRQQHKGYKNAKIFFDAIKRLRSAHFDVLCVGGEPAVEPEWLRDLPGGIRIVRRDLSDAELGAAYANAIALVYPSLYEGFGMPVVEAMASGCPVITTHRGSLREVAGEAGLIISGHDQRELLDALERVRMPEVRERLVAQGVARAAKFSWELAAEQFYALLQRAEAERHDKATIKFHRLWKRIRTAQADVDIGVD